MRVTRRAVLGAGTAAMAGVMAGCSTSNTSGGGKDQPQGGGRFNLQVMGKEEEFDKQELATFLKDKNFGISWIKPDMTNLNAMLASGKAPDLVRDAGANNTPYIAQRKLAHPLDDYLAKSSLIKADDLPAIQDVWRYDGTKQGQGPRYGLTKDYSVDSQWWMRTDMSDAAGVKAPTWESPWSHDDLLENARKMTKKQGNRATQYGLYTLEMTTGWMQTILATFGGSMYTDDGSQVDLATPEARKLIQWVIDASQQRLGYSPLDPNPDGWDWPPVAAGRQATLSSGYWVQGMLAEKEAESFRDTFRIMPSPTFGPERATANRSATGYWIPAGSKHKDEAFQLLEFTIGGADAKKRAQSGWGMPSLKSLESELPNKTEYQKQALEGSRKDLEHLKILTFTPYASFTAVDTIMAQQFLPVVKGSKKADDFVAAVTPPLNQLLKEGKI